MTRAIWLGVLIGLVSGAGAILFSEAISFATEHLLGALAGYHPPEPLGEGGPGSDAFDSPDRLWALPLVLGLGGLLSGLLVYFLAPEAEGHGTDAAIDAFHRKGGRTRLRVVPVKLVASAITIGSGGAAGREGPTAQIGGGFGSFIAERLNLGAIERRKALAAGMGAGIGAIFRAPLGGAMMAAEVMYTHDFEADVILLGLISSIVAFAVFGSYYDYSPIFGNTAGFQFENAYELPYYAALGAVCGLVGILYVRAFYGTTGLFKRLRIPWIAKPVLGGVLAGLIGMAIPESIHVGYGWVQRSLTVEQLADFSPWLLLALPFARIATTSLTVGSGGSGGIFGPGMVIGGMTGALAYRAFHDLPGFPQEPGPVVIIGMIAMFGSVSHAPLAMLLMVGEMTGNLSLLAPAMVAVAVATLLVGDITIYKSQVPTRADSNAHRHRFAFPLLSALPAQRAVAPLAQIPEDFSLLQAISVLESSGTTQAVVIASDGSLLGDLSLESLRAGAASNANQPVTAVAGRIPSTIPADMPLDEALDRLTAQERRWLPVVDPHDRGRVLGAFDARALIRSYRRAVSSQVRPLTPVDENLSTMELTLPSGSPVAGLPLSDAGLPSGVRILTIERDGRVSPPEGATVLQPGDRLTIALPASTSARVFKPIPRGLKTARPARPPLPAVRTRLPAGQGERPSAGLARPRVVRRAASSAASPTCGRRSSAFNASPTNSSASPLSPNTIKPIMSSAGSTPSQLARNPARIAPIGIRPRSRLSSDITRPCISGSLCASNRLFVNDMYVTVIDPAIASNPIVMPICSARVWITPSSIATAISAPANTSRFSTICVAGRANDSFEATTSEPMTAPMPIADVRNPTPESPMPSVFVASSGTKIC